MAARAPARSATAPRKNKAMHSGQKQHCSQIVGCQSGATGLGCLHELSSRLAGCDRAGLGSFVCAARQPEAEQLNSQTAAKTADHRLCWGGSSMDHSGTKCALAVWALLPEECTALSGHPSRLLPGVHTCPLGRASVRNPYMLATSKGAWMRRTALARATAAVHVSIAPTPTMQKTQGPTGHRSLPASGTDLSPARWASWVRPAQASPSAGLPVAGWLVWQSVRVLPGASLHPHRSRNQQDLRCSACGRPIDVN